MWSRSHPVESSSDVHANRQYLGVVLVAATFISACSFDPNPPQAGVDAPTSRPDGGGNEGTSDGGAGPDASSSVDAGDQPVTCGNGVLGEDEQCDDANDESNDGCNDACLIEEGWTCDGGSPTTCRRLPALVLTSTTISEGALARVRATLSTTVSTDVTFKWSTEDATATAPTDYIRVAPTTATISAGGSFVWLEVFSLEDDDVEPTESLTIRVEAIVGATEPEPAMVAIDLPALTRRGLVTRYRLNEIANGTVPTIWDAGPPPASILSADITPNGPLFVTSAHGRGLEWNAAGGDGSFTATVSEKLIDALDGSRTMTIETVFRFDDAVGTSRVVEIGRAAFTAGALGVNDTQVQFLFLDTATIRWDVDELRGAKQPSVVTIVFDSERPPRDDRAILYVDGQRMPPPLWAPFLNEEMAMLPTDLLLIGNREDAIRSLDGEIYYVAIYASALSAKEVAANVAALLRSND